jgi:hypothetical protein
MEYSLYLIVSKMEGNFQARRASLLNEMSLAKHGAVQHLNY